MHSLENKSNIADANQQRYQDNVNYRRGVQTDVVPSNPDSPSAIRDTVTHIESLLSGLHIQVGVTEKRLDTVLESVPPAVSQACNGAKEAQTNNSHLLERLYELGRSVEYLLNRLQDLTRRVQV